MQPAPMEPCHAVQVLHDLKSLKLAVDEAGRLFLLRMPGLLEGLCFQCASGVAT